MRNSRPKLLLHETSCCAPSSPWQRTSSLQVEPCCRSERGFGGTGAPSSSQRFFALRRTRCLPMMGRTDRSFIMQMQGDHHRRLMKRILHITTSMFSRSQLQNGAANSSVRLSNLFGPKASRLTRSLSFTARKYHFLRALPHQFRLPHTHLSSFLIQARQSNSVTSSFPMKTTTTATTTTQLSTTSSWWTMTR